MSLESEGDINYVHSYFCPAGQDPRYTSGCTLRDQRMILPEKSPLTFRVSSTGLSAKVVGRARAVNLDSHVSRDIEPGGFITLR